MFVSLKAFHSFIPSINPIINTYFFLPPFLRFSRHLASFLSPSLPYFSSRQPSRFFPSCLHYYFNNLICSILLVLNLPFFRWQYVLVLLWKQKIKTLAMLKFQDGCIYNFTFSRWLHSWHWSNSSLKLHFMKYYMAKCLNEKSLFEGTILLFQSKALIIQWTSWKLDIQMLLVLNELLLVLVAG